MDVQTAEEVNVLGVIVSVVEMIATAAFVVAAALVVVTIVPSSVVLFAGSTSVRFDVLV